MNPELGTRNSELEALVDRELKALPPLSAPPNLAPRILAAIAAQAEAPWYRRAWQTWPLPLQGASLAVLLALFGTLCFGGWRFSQTEAVVETSAKVGGVLSVFDLVFRTLGVLRDAGVQVIQHIGPGYVIGFAVMVLMAYAVCLALGSVCVRFAFARR
jgi:hypothetical protein